MRRHRRGDEEAEINMTPMLDIVFIMLIFFIVTTSFVKESTEYKADSGSSVSNRITSTAGWTNS